MHIDTIVVGSFEVNCYIVTGAGAESLVVDPGADADAIIRHIERGRRQVAAYLLTHGHIDHIGALSEVHRRFPAQVTLHADDNLWAFSEVNQFPPDYPPLDDPPPAVRLVKDGSVFRDCGIECRVVTTPGHTPGSVCYHFPAENVLFTGDTLFAGSVGRTDLPGGNPRVLSESLRRLKDFAPATRIYPGHGPASTLDRERRSNFFMRDA